MKKKIRPEDLRINVKVIADIMNSDSRDRDTYSEQHGTGSLCVSIAVCMPTTKECNVSISEGQLCCDTSVRCEFITKGCVSDDYCIVTDSMCVISEGDCFVSNDDGSCLVSINTCEVHPAQPSN